MSKKKNQRESARQAAEKFAAQNSAKDNRTRNILIGVIGVVILALVGVGFMLVKESQKTLLSVFEGEAPAVATESGGIPFGGSPVTAGKTNEGAPEVAVYLDFACPACGDFELINAEDLRTMVEDGEATLVYHPVNILDRTPDATGYSTRAANAMVEVAENAPDRVFDFVAILFENQPGGEGYTDEQIGEFAAAAGVPDEVIAKFSDGRYMDWVQQAREQASRDGMTGTPSLRVNGTIVPHTELNWAEPGAVREFVLADS